MRLKECFSVRVARVLALAFGLAGVVQEAPRANAGTCEACSNESLAETPRARPSKWSDMEISLVRDIAKQFPCTAIAIVHVLQGDAKRNEGTLYLDEVASPDVMARVLADVAAQRTVRLEINPYSDRPFLIQVRWSVRDRSDGAILLSFRSQRISRTGATLRPPHWVEPAAQLILSDREVTFLASGFGASEQTAQSWHGGDRDITRLKKRGG